jgi:excisionase family DNA binding protein
MDRSLLTPAQVARQLNVSGGTVRRWLTEGHMPFIKTPGGQYRIDPRRLDEWLAKLDQAPEPERSAA